MKKIINIIGVLFVLSCFSTMIYHFFISNYGNDRCQWQREFDKRHYYGIVTAKFYDHANHSVPKVILRDIGKATIDTIDFLGDSSTVFDNLGKFDTVIKNVNSSEIFVKSDGYLKTVGKVVFGCELPQNAEK